MDFKLDENLPEALKVALHKSGHDAHTCIDEGIAGSIDPVVASHAADEDRILITLDLDFADIRNYPPGTHPGIIVLRLVRQDAASCIRAVESCLTQLVPDDIQNNLIISEDTRIRIRRAPTNDDEDIR